MNEIARVVKKIEHFDGVTWRAYMPAQEAKLLLDRKAIFSKVDEEDIEKFVKSGHAKPKWWYFKLPADIARTLNAMR